MRRTSALGERDPASNNNSNSNSNSNGSNSDPSSGRPPANPANDVARPAPVPAPRTRTNHALAVALPSPQLNTRSDRNTTNTPTSSSLHYNHNHNHNHNSKLQKKSKPSPLEPPAKEPKKKRRIWGAIFGSPDASPSSTSSHKQPQPQPQSGTSPTSAKSPFGRSISTRSRPISYQGSASSRSPSVTVDKEDYFSSANPSRPAPIEEESVGINRSTTSVRHSIAIFPTAAQSASTAPQLELQSPVSSLSSFDVGKVSAPQFQDPQGGSRPPPSDWSDRGKGPNSQYPYSSSTYLNISDSRPSSRQSLNDPPQPRSPVEGQYTAYPGRREPGPPVRLDPSREPSPLPQAPLQQRNPVQYDNSLHPTDPGKKTRVGMVQGPSNNERGTTPPPSKSKEDLATLDFPQLLSKHEELNDKYRKVKKYYFEKDSQVQQLQNTLAHQRLAQSRTSLDDNEYANRFQRLDGAINNLAFNVRKDWKAVPPWLSPYVNNDATTKVTKEMTAVGRACISRWLVDEIFDRVFHPALEPGLSASLKIIERNLRRFSPPVNTDEERDALLTKISNWRLATLDGLSEALNSPQATEYRNELTRGLVETLTSDLQMNLTTPPPAGLEAGVIGIIELAVGVAANLPLESRDVYVEYILPGIPLNDAYMKLEGTLPPLINPGESYATEQEQHLQQQRRGSADEQMGGDDQGGNPVIGGFVGAGPKDKKAGGAGKKGEDERKEIEKVRFAAFMSVMVKGKSMLVKAPVFV